MNATAARAANIVLEDERRERAASVDETLVQVLARRMYGNPAEAYGVVSGTFCWPPINGEYVGELACDAANLAHDATGFKRLQYLAAEQAFVWLERDGYEAAREADDAEDNRAGPRFTIGRML